MSNDRPKSGARMNSYAGINPSSHRSNGSGTNNVKLNSHRQVAGEASGNMSRLRSAKSGNHARNYSH